LEHAYSEEVRVVNGLCEIESATTRDYLLKSGYEEVEVEDAGIAPSLNGSSDSEPVPKSSRPKPKKKPRR
jgi:hypothetical protein